MVTFIENKNLNKEKYNACVQKSVSANLYGRSWFLDLVSKYWGALVLNNYEAVLPVFTNKKFGLCYSLQPYFCQQINIYTSLIITDDLIGKFVKAIPKSIIYLK